MLSQTLEAASIPPSTPPLSECCNFSSSYFSSSEGLWIWSHSACMLFWFVTYWLETSLVSVACQINCFLCKICQEKRLKTNPGIQAFLQFQCRNKHRLYCMIECKKKKENKTKNFRLYCVYFICQIECICMLHDFKIKVIL